MYEKEVADILQKIIKPGNTCIEVGACCGEHTPHLSDLVGEGRVISIEPAAYNMDHIRKLQLPNIETHEVAVSDFTGQADLFHGRGGSNFEFNLRGEDVCGNKTKPYKQVKVITIDGLLNNACCDIMLIDVEGHAGKVLRGAIKTISACQPYIILEVHDNGEWKEIQEAINYKFYNLKLEEISERNYFTLAIPPSKSIVELGT